MSPELLRLVGACVGIAGGVVALVGAGFALARRAPRATDVLIVRIGLPLSLAGLVLVVGATFWHFL